MGWEVLSTGSIDTIYNTVGESGDGDHAMTLLKTGGHYVTIAGGLPKHTPSGKHAASFINSNDNLENIELLEALRNIVENEQLRMKTLKTYQLTDILSAFQESSAGHVDGKLIIQMPPAEDPSDIV